MRVESNITQIVGKILSGIGDISNPETVSRAAAAAVLPELRERIHERGEKSDGTPIGTYSNSYLRLRERKGKGANAKVIASFTRALQNGYTLKAEGNGYLIGNISEDGNEKVKYLTEMYGDLWKLSLTEQDMARIAAADIAVKLIQG
jgi:hypothetical protein